MNVRVVYEAAPIQCIAVECPKCKRWFRGSDITNYLIRYDVDISYAHFKCPVCGEIFNGFDDVKQPEYSDLEVVKVSNVNIETVYFEGECYKDCLKSKVIWES